MLELFGQTLNTTIGDDFFLTKSGMRKIQKKLAMEDVNFHRNLKRLEASGLIFRKERGFMITPKGRNILCKIKIESEDWGKKDWDGFWQIVTFDIPEKKKQARDSLRKFLIRKGFYRLQDSVFISPFADLEALNFMRHEFGIAENVNVFVSKSAKVDDDRKLKELFNLK